MNFHDLERLLVLFQVFRGLNCTSESLRGNSGAVSDVTISRCLKEASLHDLLTVKVRKSPLTWKMAKVSFQLFFLFTSGRRRAASKITYHFTVECAHVHHTIWTHCWRRCDSGQPFDHIEPLQDIRQIWRLVRLDWIGGLSPLSGFVRYARCCAIRLGLFVLQSNLTKLIDKTFLSSSIFEVYLLFCLQYSFQL